MSTATRQYDPVDSLVPPEIEDSSQGRAFASLSLLLALLILRPWDVFPALATVRPLMLVTILTIGLFLSGRPRIEFLNVRPAKLLLALLFMICVSVLFSYWPSQSFAIATDYTKQIVLFVLIVNLVTTLSRLKTFIVVFVGGCTCHGALAVIDFASGGGQRMVGIAEPYFGDPNDLALSLVLVLPLAWWLGSVVQTRLARFAAYACMLVLVSGIVATQSRGGLLALLAAIAVMVFRQGRERRGTLLLTVAAATALSVVILPADVFDRYLTITKYQQDESAMIRLAVWNAGMQMFADHPLTGVGAGTFETVYGQRYIDRKSAGNIWRAAHSSYVEIAAELGLIGLIIWLAILASAFNSLFQSQRLLDLPVLENDIDRYVFVEQLLRWNSALFASVVGFLIGAAFLSRGYDMLFMIVLALIAVLLRKSMALAGPSH